MKIRNALKRLQLWRFGWHILIALLAVVGVVCRLVGEIQDQQTVTAIGRIVIQAAFWIAFFAFLLSNREIIRSLKDNGDRLDNVAEMISRNNNLMAQIAQASKLSDAAKSIAFRDAERTELAEAVIAKLHAHEFEATTAMINAMERKTEYQTLAAQLRRTAEQYRNATEKERIRQAIEHILKLGREYRWTQAYRAAENLIKAYPHVEEAKAVRAKLKQIRDARKRELLALWDEAVRAKDTDRSLEILKELDLYLTPSEGLALQDAASNVFKMKLHNLGVRFSLAVTENQWVNALETGQQIMRDFPNSRMAHEIRSKLDILEMRAKQQQNVEPQNPAANRGRKVEAVSTAKKPAAGSDSERHTGSNRTS